MTTAALIREQATAEHKSAARELATFLAIYDREAARRFVEALRRDLRTEEAVAVAVSAFLAVEPEDRGRVLGMIEREGAMPSPLAGGPMDPFSIEPDDLRADAALWAVAAYPEERRAYAMAALANMPEEERAAILRAFERRT